MNRNYKGTYVIKMQSLSEGGIEEVITNITKTLEDKKIVLEQIDRVGRKEFAHTNFAKQTHGYYVQFKFNSTPDVIKEVDSELKTNEFIMLQNYQKF